MSDGLNRVTLVGNLGADPELRFTQGGQAVLNMRLATTESYLDKDKVRRERTDWHNVVVWGKRGEALAKILTKGTRVLIEGSLRTSSYDDKDGTKRYKTEINCTNVILCGRRREGGDDAGGDDEGERDRQDAGGGYAPRPQSSGSGAGDFEVAFGRDKGKRISQVEDLSWLRGKLEDDLADPSKAKYHDKARGQIVAIDAELARRGSGGGGGGYGGGARETARTSSGGGGRGRAEPPPASDYGGGDDSGGGFGNDDDMDIPF